MICPPCRAAVHALCENNLLARPIPGITDETGLWCYCHHEPRDKS